ncbi:MAG: hypothetical protein Q4B17_02360 [Lautropia sp.]|nr:hypothetical protein [Lautropia sp.]
MSERSVMRLSASVSQQGFIMIIALVMLAIMGVGAAVAFRMSMTSDMIGTNLRQRSLAFQAAEAALKYCEEQVISNPERVTMLTGQQPRQEWMDEETWNASHFLPPAEALNLPANLKHHPRCLVRHFTLEQWRDVSPPRQGTVTVESRGFDPKRVVLYRITARGFSPDYQPPKKLSWKNDYDYQSAVGAEVRLQSMIRAIK